MKNLKPNFFSLVEIVPKLATFCFATIIKKRFLDPSKSGLLVWTMVMYLDDGLANEKSISKSVTREMNLMTQARETFNLDPDK